MALELSPRELREVRETALRFALDHTHGPNGPAAVVTAAQAFEHYIVTGTTGGLGGEAPASRSKKR